MASNDLFKVSAPDLINLRKFYKRAPKQFTFAVANMLNSFAFGTREQAFKVLKGSMTIRNARFVSKMLRAETIKGSTPIASQQSIAGSLDGQRFTGWAEQELGKAPKKTRTASLFARSGQHSKQMKRKARLVPGTEYLTPDDFKGKNAHHRAVVLLIVTNRNRLKDPFVIKGHDTLSDGLYQWSGKGKLKWLQNFEETKKPKSLPWLTRARKRYFSKTNITRLWEKTLTRTLKLK